MPAVPLETLARHSRTIATVWWISSLSGPIWFALVVVLVRRGRQSRDLRWTVD